MPRRKTVPSRPDAATAALLQTRHPHAAGIDIGATELWVCVPPSAVLFLPTPTTPLPAHVRGFGVFTADLHTITAWLRQCGVTTVAMESTGVYWIPLYDVLEQAGFAVLLVDPRQVQRAPNRPKTDVHDCQWIQRLHTLGRLSAAFRPDDPVVVLRSSLRLRLRLLADAARSIPPMQTALTQMNITLQHVVSDITGVTGRRIIQALLNGEREPLWLAALRDWRCKEEQTTIAQALHGTWREEHLFALQQAVAAYEFCHPQSQECDAKIAAQVQTFALSGALAGLGGTSFVLGYKHWFELDFTAGAGFMGIAVALLGRNHPLGVIIAALFFGGLAYGGLVVNQRVPSDLVNVLRALVILFAISSHALFERWARRKGL